MEQSLAEFESDINHFKLHHKNQYIKDNNQYQNWKENAIKFINTENLNPATEENILFIDFCDNCYSFSIFKCAKFSEIKCYNCQNICCIGCRKHPLTANDYSTCLKGFLIVCYLRVVHENINIYRHIPLILILHVIFSLLFTPLYIGYIFNMLGFLSHRGNNRLRNNGQINDFTDNKKKLLSIHIFSIIKGILFFPYIITFFPFILLILLPGICFKKYYFKIFTFYVSIILAGGLDIKRKYSYYL